LYPYRSQEVKEYIREMLDWVVRKRKRKKGPKFGLKSKKTLGHEAKLQRLVNGLTSSQKAHWEGGSQQKTRVMGPKELGKNYTHTATRRLNKEEGVCSVNEGKEWTYPPLRAIPLRHR